MKKGIYLLLLLVGLTSCGEDLVFNNNAAFQGVKDNDDWKAADASAVISDENLIEIQAITMNETVTLKIPRPTTMVNQKESSSYIIYDLGINETTKATYASFLSGSLLIYETGTKIGDGQIVITNYDGFTISGKFRFNVENTASSSSKPSIVNFQYGVFYMIPVTF